MTLTVDPIMDEMNPEIWSRLPLKAWNPGPAVLHDFVIAGYPIVTINMKRAYRQWARIHKWCHNNIQVGHYTWCSNQFIFVNDDDAVLFNLTWGGS